ncbi:MAG: hypothetical protein BWY85_02437 [Firmicutes bacterium ADurb.Bin506]|nr:MAG: hypothetical protein BWY85_02437 [Firmicutes bacterium ADurb.Bin506]
MPIRFTGFQNVTTNDFAGFYGAQHNLHGYNEADGNGMWKRWAGVTATVASNSPTTCQWGFSVHAGYGMTNATNLVFVMKANQTNGYDIITVASTNYPGVVAIVTNVISSAAADWPVSVPLTGVLATGMQGKVYNVKLLTYFWSSVATSNCWRVGMEEAFGVQLVMP